MATVSNMNLAIIIVIAITQVCHSLTTNGTLCSHVFQMHRFCFHGEHERVQYSALRVGKAGPRGPRGPAGRTAEIDYNRIYDRMDQKLEAVLERVAILEELVTWYRASNGHLYKVFTEKATYDEGIRQCKKYGAALAVVGVIDPNIRRELLNLTIASGESTYVGADDRRQEGSFYWLNGSPLRPQDVNWQQGQPDDAGRRQDCAIFAKFFGWKFDDILCDAKLNYMCEKIN